MPHMTEKNRLILMNLAAKAGGFDRSWSLTLDGRAEERFLLFFERSRLAVRDIEQAAHDLGAPDHMIKAWSDVLTSSDAVGIAFNRDLSSIRLYTQYWREQVRRVIAGNIDPFVLYRGVKLLGDGTLRDDAYICQPMAPTSIYWPPIEAGCLTFGLTLGGLASGLATLEPETCVYTQTAGHGRTSWLATVRKAEPDQAAVKEMVAPLKGSDWGDALHDHAGKHDLLHLAGGEDPKKGAFLTIYFSSDLKTLDECLSV
jgi:hypothetical protein